MRKLVTKKNVFVIALLGFTLSIALAFSWGFGVSYSFYKIFVEPLFFLSGSLFFVAVLFFFTRDQVFSAWLKFAKWWLPLSLMLIILSPTDGSSAFFPALFSKELTSMWMSSLFVAISLFIITYKYFTLKKSGAGE